MIFFEEVINLLKVAFSKMNLTFPRLNAINFDFKNDSNKLPYRNVIFDVKNETTQF